MKVKTLLSFVFYYVADISHKIFCYLENKWPALSKIFGNFLFWVYGKSMSISANLDVEEKVWH